MIPLKIKYGINDLPSWYVYSLSHKSLKPLKFVAIAIDEDSLSRSPERWPWKRSLYSRIVKILDAEKVNTVGIDFAFIGEAEDKQEDISLKEALKNSSCRTVLAYFFDAKKQSPVFPLESLKNAAYSIGMVNTPQDKDNKARRLRAYVKQEENVYYSFAVQISAAFLGKPPKEITSSLPLAEDGTFAINYLLQPKDAIRISFYDVLENLDKLKEAHGRDFLKGSLVLIYPEAGIFHDLQLTPLGRMPGGFLHLNGAADIIRGSFLKELRFLTYLFLGLSFAVTAWILLYSGFLYGLLFTLGIAFAEFWALILLGLNGIKFDYGSVSLFCLVFFGAGSLYKYAYFLAQLLKIKGKATLDPLRNLYTIRYFYYRLELALKKIYFYRDSFVVLIYLESFAANTESFSLEKTRQLWQEISGIISLKESFWSAYTQEELSGYIICPRKRIRPLALFLKNNLQAMLAEKGVQATVRIGYAKVKKSYPARELLFALSAELKQAKDEVALFEDKRLANLLSPALLKAGQAGKFLESLDQDIEEKNRQLLSLLDNLSREHAKTEEAFFQIIASLVNALEARDPYTQGHSERVCFYAVRVSEKLGWNRHEQEKLKKAALLHDLGKIGIPDNILHKRDKLTEEEFDFIKKHEIIGVKILEPLKEMSDILPWILYHHERWDGKGYPHGLAGDAIPQAARIISLADVFDALTTGRDYKQAFPKGDAIKEIIKNKGSQFDPELADIFIETVSGK